MADKVKSGKERPGAHSPHPFQKRIKPVDLPPMEDPVFPQEGAAAQPSSLQPNVPGNQGPEDDKFKSAKDRHPSPHPRQLRQGHVDVAGARTTGFGMSEAIVSTGAVGGSVSNVDVHPHGEVKQAMLEKEKDSKETAMVPAHRTDMVVYEAGRRVGVIIRTFSSRIRGYVSRIKHRPRSFPDPIPEPLPATEFSSDSGTHSSLVSGPLNLPDINYSVTDSEETSDQTSDRPVVDPVTSSPEEEKPDPRSSSVPEAVHPKSEDPGRRSKSAPAVLQTSADLQTSHDSDNSDNEGDQDGTKDFRDDDSSPVPIVSGTAATPGNKSPVPHRESEGDLESPVLVLPEGAGLVIPHDSSPSTSVMPLKPRRDPSPSKRLMKPKRNSSPSEMFLKPEQDPVPSASNMYRIRTQSPVEIQVSQNMGQVYTCISFDTTPPTSDKEHDSGESDGDE